MVASPVRVKVKRDEEWIAAVICTSISAEALRQYYDLWLPMLPGEEDEEWDWQDFLGREHRDGCDYMSLWVGTICEGLAIVRRQRPMRGIGATGLNGCYVERLCTAPWNRITVRARAACERPRVRPIGKWLLWRAAKMSVDLGSEGRLAWHSLSGDRDDYKRMLPHLQDLGPDEDEDGLPWYELDAVVGIQLIKEMGNLLLVDEPRPSGTKDAGSC